MKKIKKNNTIILCLFVVVVFMSVWFTMLSSSLNISGTTNKKRQIKDIYIEELSINDNMINK